MKGEPPMSKITKFVPKEPMLPSFEEMDEAEERKDTIYAGNVPLPSIETQEGRAYAILGALDIIDHVAISGTEFWQIFSAEPAKSVYQGWVRNAHAKLSDILSKAR